MTSPIGTFASAYENILINTSAPVLTWNDDSKSATFNCTTGSWNQTVTSYNYEFIKTAATEPATVQSGASSTYLAGTVFGGQTFKCIVQATSPNGQASVISNTIIIPS